MNKWHRWTKQEDAIVRASFPYKDIPEWEHLLPGISRASIRRRAKQLGATVEDRDVRLWLKTKERFEKYVVRSINKDSCWQWKGKKRIGYGVLTLLSGKKKIDGAHRVSWVLHYGSIPDGLFVCHKCDNPECTNPSHLFLGTPKDNVHDAISKGRFVSQHALGKPEDTERCCKVCGQTKPIKHFSIHSKPRLDGTYRRRYMCNSCWYNRLKADPQRLARVRVQQRTYQERRKYKS